MISMDRLQRAKFRPLFVEDAVRTALRDAIAWRIGAGSAPSSDAFVAAAVASARLALDAADCDSAERSRTLAAVQRAAKRFTASALCRRLMSVPPYRFLRLAREAHAADVIVRDAARHLHAVALTVRGDAFEAGRFATRVAQSTPLAAADRLAPLTIHVFSLADGTRHMFERDVPHARPPVPSNARVA
jgi:hypothetical protein